MHQYADKNNGNDDHQMVGVARCVSQLVFIGLLVQKCF